MPTTTSDSLAEQFALLDTENEYLRMRLLTMATWMEEAVTNEVACERRLVETEVQAQSLEDELDAIHQTLTWRVLAPSRRMYGRIQEWRSAR